MKRIWQYIACAVLAVSAAACTPEYPVVSSAGLPQASDLDVTITVDQATNYVTFVMNNKEMVPVWIFGDQKIDGKASKKYAYTENGVSLRFRDAGEYTVEVKAYNANGLSNPRTGCGTAAKAATSAAVPSGIRSPGGPATPTARAASCMTM